MNSYGQLQVRGQYGNYGGWTDYIPFVGPAKRIYETVTAPDEEEIAELEATKLELEDLATKRAEEELRLQQKRMVTGIIISLILATGIGVGAYFWSRK